MNRLLIAIGILLTGLFACQQDTEGYVLEGKLEGMADQELVLQYLTFQNSVNMDTTTTDSDGNFKFEGKDNKTGYYRIAAGQKFWMVLFEKNSSMSFNANANDPQLRDYEVQGTEASAVFDQAVNFIADQQASVNDMVAEYQQVQTQMQQNAGDPEKFLALQTQLNQLQAQLEGKDAQIKTAIKDYTASINEPYTGLYLMSSLDLTKEYDFIKGKVATYEQQIPDDEYVKFYNDRLVQAEQMIAQQKAQEEQAKKTDIGAVAPEIVMKNPQGQDLKLSDLRGKVVLIDFWASWCKPCRLENPNVVATYNKYKNKGFTVFSVSLDKARDPWLAAIQQDGLVWDNHVSDLQFWNNAAAKLYGVGSIPAAFLIDEEGVIVGKNLRGPALEAKVKEILG